MTSARRLAVRFLAILGMVSFSFMLTFVVADASGPRPGAASLEPPGSTEARIGAEHPGEIVHITGAVAALAIGVSGLAGLLLRPQRSGSATQAGAAALAMVVTAVLVGNPDNHGGQAGMVDPAFLILALPVLAAAGTAAPWRTRPDSRHRPAFLALAALGSPLLWYGVAQATMQRNTWPPLADPHHQAHWWAMSLLAWLAVITVAGAALGGRGWRTGAVTSGLAVVAVALSSLTAPAAASALRPAWAIGALAWGAVVVAVTLRQPSRERGVDRPRRRWQPGDGPVPTG